MTSRYITPIHVPLPAAQSPRPWAAMRWVGRYLSMGHLWINPWTRRRHFLRD